MWKLMGTPVTKRLTKQLVQEFHAMLPAPGDRALNNARAEKLRAHIDGKTFRPVVWAKVFCKQTGLWYRVNGKHTSSVMAETNVDSKSLFVHVELYECDTLDDVASLYATFDARISARTVGDIVRSFAHAIEELADVPAATTTLAVGGISFSIWGEQYSVDAPPEKRASLLREHIPFVLWLDDITHKVRTSD